MAGDAVAVNLRKPQDRRLRLTLGAGAITKARASPTTGKATGIVAPYFGKCPSQYCEHIRTAI